MASNNINILVEAYVPENGEEIPFCIMGPAAEGGGPKDTAVYRVLSMETPVGVVIYDDLTIDEARRHLFALAGAYNDENNVS